MQCSRSRPAPDDFEIGKAGARRLAHFFVGLEIVRGYNPQADFGCAHAAQRVRLTGVAVKRHVNLLALALHQRGVVIHGCVATPRQRSQ
jgi:hypothetical protein